MKKGLLFILFLGMMSSMLFAAEPGIQVAKERICVVPAVVGDQFLGMRTEGRNIFFFFRDGSVIRMGLDSGKKEEETSFGCPILDMALYQGKPLGLCNDGSLKGAMDQNWPKGPFGACLLEAAADEVLLCGASETLFLAKNATGTSVVKEASLASPFHDAFLWAVRKNSESRSWQVDLIDMYGNRMKKMYRFSREFDPSGLTIAPAGPEGELLLSYFTGQKRELVLIGQNGRMFWKLPVPAPVCRRDIGWDNKGNLLVLEKEGETVVLNRWKFALPQG